MRKNVLGQSCFKGIMSDRLQCEAKTSGQPAQLNLEITLKVMNHEMYHKTEHFVRVTKVTVDWWTNRLRRTARVLRERRKRRNCLDETK